MKFKSKEIQTLKLKDYKDLIDNLMSEYSKYNWIKAIGQFGEIKYPGISDIDLLVYVKNGYLLKATKIFDNWLNNKEKGKYCFYHSPIFINENMFKSAVYLHSLDNIQWLRQEDPINFKDNPDKTMIILTWTLYLLPIVIKIIYDKLDVDVRESLLILKNLQSSHYFLSACLNKQSNILIKSDKLRNKLIGNNINSTEIDSEILNIIIEEYNYALNAVLDILDEFSKEKLHKMKGMLVKKNFFLSNSMIIRSSEKSQIIQKSNKFIIELNESLINLFFNIKNWKAVKTFNTYIKHLEFTFNECDAESIKMQFILPFSYPIFKRRQFIFRIKKSYQLFKNHKLLF